MVAPLERKQRETDNGRPVQPKRILIADDDAATRSMLVELFQGEGYGTLEAKTVKIGPISEKKSGEEGKKPKATSSPAASPAASPKS